MCWFLLLRLDRAIACSCVPGTWTLPASAFTEYVGFPSEGAATLSVQPDGNYTFGGRYTVRVDVGGGSAFVYDAVIDQTGVISRTAPMSFLITPRDPPGVRIESERAEGTGRAPDGVTALEPDLSEFMATNVVACADTSLLVTMRTPRRGAPPGPVTITFAKSQ